MMVRHPMERLLSSYVSTFVDSSMHPPLTSKVKIIQFVNAVLVGNNSMYLLFLKIRSRKTGWGTAATSCARARTKT